MRAGLPERIDSVRNGVYVLWIDAAGFVDLDVDPGFEGVAYVGVAAGSGRLKKRFREEWRRSSGRSTPRRTLGVLLLTRLSLVPRPRPDRDPQHGTRYYTFGDDGEGRLTTWIEDHGTFAYLETASPVDAVELEDQLVPHLAPPLNISKWNNPIGPRLGELRRQSATLASVYR